MSKRWLRYMVAGVATLLPGMALAVSLQTASEVTVPKGETRAGTFYAAGQTVTIDGTIDGDLICAGSTVEVNGDVHGDVICAGQIVNVNGKVDGSVRVAGQTVTIDGTVGRNATLAGQTVTVGSSANIAGDLGLAAQAARVNGAVAQTVYGTMETLAISSVVGGVALGEVSNMTLGSEARVNGDVKYTSEQTFDFDRSKISGEVQRTAPTQTKAQRENQTAQSELAGRLYWILAVTALGLVLVWLAPRLVTPIARTMQERIGASVGWGIVVLLLGPIVAILLLITMLGVPLGLMLGMLWFVMLMTSGLFVGVAAGQWLLRRADWHKDSLVWAAALGIPITMVIFSVPVVGWVFGFLASIWAMGGMALSAKSLKG